MKLSSSRCSMRRLAPSERFALTAPEEGNKISREMFLALNEAVDEAVRDREVRVVVFCGKGDHFCSGFDVGDPEASLNNNEEDTVDWMFRRENTREEIDLWMKIRNMRKPTIGAMKGSVLGGGLVHGHDIRLSHRRRYHRV